MNGYPKVQMFYSYICHHNRREKEGLLFYFCRQTRILVSLLEVVLTTGIQNLAHSSYVQYLYSIPSLKLCVLCTYGYQLSAEEGTALMFLLSLTSSLLTS